MKEERRERKKFRHDLFCDFLNELISSQNISKLFFLSLSLSFFLSFLSLSFLFSLFFSFLSFSLFSLFLSFLSFLSLSLFLFLSLSLFSLGSILG